MKLQIKISLFLIISLFLSTIISLTLLNVFLVFFDKSYKRNDLEKISFDIAKKINAMNTYDESKIKDILLDWKEKYKNLEFTFFNEKREFVFSTRGKMERPDINAIKKRFEEEEKEINSRFYNNFKFIDTFDNWDFISGKPIIIDNRIKGLVMVSVKEKFFFPFYIRINKDKLLVIYLIFFITIFFIIVLSYLFILVFTIPIISRLGILFNKINIFELDKPNIKINDSHNDEIGKISNTFDKMVDKINQHYSERIKFYQERQELLKNVSHDFRTPLTSILGYSISLDEGIYENMEEQAKYFKIIRKKAEYMKELFDEMMEFTRFDNNTYLLKKTSFNIAELIREIIIEYLPQLEEENFFIETKVPEKIMVNGDRERLSRAMRNIIDNVIKYASIGKYIGISVTDTGESGISIVIKDKGKGIDENDRERIFDRFYHNSKSSGMGLGLSIAREIIEKHEGSITLDVTGESGTAFNILLPC